MGMLPQEKVLVPGRGRSAGGKSGVRGVGVKKLDWIVVKEDTLGATCKRCGAEELPPPVPLAIDKYVAWANGFINQHKDCKAATT